MMRIRPVKVVVLNENSFTERRPGPVPLQWHTSRGIKKPITHAQHPPIKKRYRTETKPIQMEDGEKRIGSRSPIKSSASATPMDKRRTGSPVRSRKVALKRAHSPDQFELPIKKRNKSQYLVHVFVLPSEFLAKIFSHLNCPDLLDARLVCKNWNKAIVDTPKPQLKKSPLIPSSLLKNLSCILTRAPPPTESSYKTLNASRVPWNHVQMEMCNIPRFPSWAFHTILNKSMTSLRIAEGTFTATWLLEFIRKFQSLENLTLEMCNIESPREVSRTRSGRVGNGIITWPGPKRPLKLNLKMKNLEDTNACLKQFINNPGSPFRLTEVEITIPMPTRDTHSRRIIPEKRTAILELPKLIDSCEEALSIRLVPGFRNLSFECRNVSPQNKVVLDRMYDALLIGKYTL